VVRTIREHSIVSEMRLLDQLIAEGLSAKEQMLVRHAQGVPQKPAELNPGQLKAGVERLGKRLEALRNLDPKQVLQQHNSPILEKLEASIDDGLMRTFGADSVEYARYVPAASFDTGPLNMYHDTPLDEVQEHVEHSKARSIALLEQAIEGLQEQLDEAPILFDAEITAPLVVAESNRVFIVHGHDAEAREAVARFLGQIGFDPIILHEKPNEGRTLIEKFEAHGDVTFAVVLLTPDDVGGLDINSLNARARQNVILELGYFVGRLGRRRVCALKRGDVELPSDYVGVVYEEFDSGGAWKIALAKELDAVGHKIDWNKVMRG
jgi:predicted nucleotide-binding protein